MKAKSFGEFKVGRTRRNGATQNRLRSKILTSDNTCIPHTKMGVWKLLICVSIKFYWDLAFINDLLGEIGLVA